MCDEHPVSCNCMDCWWANDQREVDEFGIPLDNDDKED